MQYLLLQSHTAKRTDPCKVAVPKGSAGFWAWGQLHGGLAHRCPKIGPAGKLLTAALSKRSPRFPLHRNPLRIPTTSTGRHIYKANPGESGSCPTAGAGTAPGPSPKPRRDPAPKCPFPGAARRRPPVLPPPLRLRAVPADGRAAAGEAPSSPHLRSAPSPRIPGRRRGATRSRRLREPSAARQRFPGMRPPTGREGEQPCRRWLGITGSEGARGAEMRAAPCSGINQSCPWGGGEAAALAGSGGSGRRRRGRGVAAGQGAPAGRSPPPAAGEALTLPNHLFRRGRGGRGGGCEGRKSAGGGGFAWLSPWCEEHGEACGVPGRGRAGAGGRQAGAEGRRGGNGEVPEPWAPPSSASSKPQGLKHAHSPPPRNLYTPR